MFSFKNLDRSSHPDASRKKPPAKRGLSSKSLCERSVMPAAATITVEPAVSVEAVGPVVAPGPEREGEGRAVVGRGIVDRLRVVVGRRGVIGVGWRRRRRGVGVAAGGAVVALRRGAITVAAILA